MKTTFGFFKGWKAKHILRTSALGWECRPDFKEAITNLVRFEGQRSRRISAATGAPFPLLKITRTFAEPVKRLRSTDSLQYVQNREWSIPGSRKRGPHTGHVQTA